MEEGGMMSVCRVRSSRESVYLGTSIGIDEWLRVRSDDRISYSFFFALDLRMLHG